MNTVQQSIQHVAGMHDLAGLIGPILTTAKRLQQAKRSPRLLEGKTVLLVFEKHSTRTRVSFEVGIQKLGGTVVSLDAATSQMGRGESIEDTAKVLSRYADCIVYRANSHANLEAMAAHATVPVINALTDLEHPCQILADWMALDAAAKGLAGKTFSYIGDGNNLCHSYLLGAPLVGMNVRIACPAGYGPEPNMVALAKQLAKRAGTSVHVGTEPPVAVQGAHAVATDTWISMGDEAEENARLAAFAGYTVDDALLDQARPGAFFMHCLPGHWGHEATHAVAHGPRSLIYEEAENRMWAQMALLVHLLVGDPGLPAA